MTTIKTNQALIAAALFGGTALLMMPAMSDPAFAATDAGANTLAIAPPSVLTFDQKLDGKTVTIKDFVTPGTVDEYILANLNEKRSVSESLAGRGLRDRLLALFRTQL